MERAREREKVSGVELVGFWLGLYKQHNITELRNFRSLKLHLIIYKVV